MPTVKPPPPPPLTKAGSSGLRPQAPPTFVPSKTPAAGTKLPETTKAADPIVTPKASPSASMKAVSAPTTEPAPVRPSASMKAVTSSTTTKAAEPAVRPSASMKAVTPEATTKAAEPAVRPSASMKAVTPEATTKAAEPAAEAKPAAAGTAAAIAAKYAAPSNPETAELEKNDPRHAAARRLARLSVSEIKLYHEKEVTEGRANKDLWKRLQADIALATQTYDKRVDQEVRDRFDYLYDEILRQLGEGDAEKLGPEAPKKKLAEPAPRAPQETPPAAEPAPVAKAAEPEPAPVAKEPEPVPVAKEPEPAPKEPEPAPKPEPVVAEPAPRAPQEQPKPAAEEKKEATPAAAPLTGAAAIAAKYAAPSNPKTAELEKNDPRHAAARRLARLSVSEIKLYHEKEVSEGRSNNDLWKRLQADIGLARQTYDKRVDQEVRDRFDYLYDEILRQLAEGDAAKLGPEAPKPAE
jgi:hypothetical protein